MSYSEIVASDGPIAYWPLGDPAAATVADAAGTHAATRLGGVLSGQPGAIGDNGKAMSFDGSTGYLRAANGPALQLAADLTLELWINVSLSGRQTLISKASNGEFELTAEPAGFLNFFHGNGTTMEIVRSSSNVLSPNTWQHVVVTRSAATHQIAFYVNGVARGGGAYAINPAATASPVVIGRSDGSGGSRYVNGRLDEVAIYSGALGAGQVASHYAARTSSGAATAIALQLQGSDPDGDALSYGATGLPSTLSVDPATGLITGVLSSSSVGTYQITATLSDGQLSSSQTFTWTVSHVNRGPSLVNPGDRRDFDVSSYAQGVLDDAPVAYWRLDDGLGGTAGDSAGAATATIVGGVAGSQAGVLADGNETMGFDGATGYLRVANAPALQQNGDLTIEVWINVVTLAVRQTLVSKASNGEFELTAEPSGFLNFFQGNGTATEVIRSNFGVLVPNTWQHIVVTRSTATRQIAFFIDGAAKGGGTYLNAPVATSNRVVIGRSDGSSGSRYVSGRLDEVAIYPRVLPAARVAAHHSLRSLTGSPAAVALQLSASDPEASGLTYNVKGLPASLTFNALTGLISGTLGSANVGAFAVTATASDGQLSNSQTFTWTVAHANRRPVLTQPANQTSAENDAISLSLSASDPESKPISYGASGLPASLTINPATGVIAGTLSFSSAGTYQVTATASDGALAATRTFTWTIADTNRAPVLANPGPQTSESASYAEVVLAGGPVAYWRLSDTTGTSASDAVGLNAGARIGAVTTGQPGALGDGNPAMGFDGSSGYLRVPNSAGLQCAGDLTIELWINVTLGGRQTLVSKASNGEFELTAEPGGFLNFFQGDGTTTEVTRSDFGVLVANTWQHVVVARRAANRQIVFYVNGTARGGGSYQRNPITTANGVVIGRSDGSGGSRYVTGRLDDVAIYPVALGAAQVATHHALRARTGAGAPVTLQLSAADPDNNAVTYGATGLPSTLTINAATGLVSGTVAAADAGVYQVTATATDGNLSTSQSFTWTIRATAPAGTLTLTPENAAPAVLGTNVSFRAAATGGTPPYLYKWFSYASTSGWSVLRDWSASDTYVWTPAGADVGAHVTVWVRSAGNLSNAPEKSADVAHPVVPPAAVLALPAAGDLSRPLTWTAVPLADAYRVSAGTTPGASDLLDSGELHQTSYDVSRLADGTVPRSVAWDSQVEGFDFQGYAIRLDSERTDLGVVALSNCPDSSIVACHRVELPPLSTGPHTIEVSAYNAAGESSAAPIAINEANRPVYLRLWTRIAGSWYYTDSSLLPASLAAQFVYPIGGAVRVDIMRPISWSPVAGAEAYSLAIGRSLGGSELVNLPELHVTSYQAVLPADQTLHARLGTRVSGVWRYREIAFSVAPWAASLFSPSDGGTVPDSAVTFWWNEVPGAAGYRLDVGTAVGGSSLVSSIEQTETHLTVPALPARTLLYVRLWTRLNGTWRSVDSTFTAGVPTSSVPPTSGPARLVHPRNGETVDGGTLRVAWTPAAGAAGYRLKVGTAPGAGDVAQSPDFLSATEYTVAVPAGADLYIRLYTQSAPGDLTRYIDITARTRAASAPSCPCSLWNATAAPLHIEDTDPSAVTLGVRFQSDRSGYVTGIRFYKAGANLGPHVGSLWTADGTLLGSVTFTSESASGWQQATFATPIAITAGTTYVASYFTPSGHYAEDNWYFDTPFDSSPLHTVLDGVGTSVYRYGGSNAFPNQPYKASNYWIDVIFVDGAQP